MATWTDESIKRAVREAKASGADVWLTGKEKTRGIGRLRLRVTPSGGGIFYFRYTDTSGRRDQLALGIYNSKGADTYNPKAEADDAEAGLAIKGADAKADHYSKLYREHRDLRAYLEEQAVLKKREREEAERASEAAERKAKSGSFKALLDAYVAHLKAQRKQSAKDVENLFRLNVFDAFPELIAKRAGDITKADTTAIVSKMLGRLRTARPEDGGRAAGKLRSYLHAAFSAALEVEDDPDTHPDLLGFELAANPVAASRKGAKRMRKYDHERGRHLSPNELREFMKRVQASPGLAADAIMLLLYLGGQREMQLLRVERGDVDLEGRNNPHELRTVTLYDPKGARTKPRVHVVPLTDRAAEIVVRLVERATTIREGLEKAGKPASRFYVFTSFGKVALRAETLSSFVREISDAMVADKTAAEPFQLRDIRRTCETMLASKRLGVSKDLRAQLLSHGIGGVQDKHYDQNTYLEEKLHALEAWDRRLREIAEGEPAGKVVQLRPGNAA